MAPVTAPAAGKLASFRTIALGLPAANWVRLVQWAPGDPPARPKLGLFDTNAPDGGHAGRGAGARPCPTWDGDCLYRPKV